ncbi:MAG: carboxypeptidase-like regulatory domain-containing protein, partial [Candidatus Thermoplasmatota archaeon]|nr:carboxypeptidase-like regulatory domain-containing protein [Candidatus Thermoplasmatota archaeon]
IPISVSNAVGFSLQPITVQRTITVGASVVDGIVYWNLANSTVYQTNDLPVSDAQVVLWNVTNGTPIKTTSNAGGTFELQNIAPGVYNESVLYDGTNYTFSGNITVDSSLSPVNASFGLTPGAITGTITNATGDAISGATVMIGSSSGRVLTATSTLTGTYDIPNLNPGSYTITAVGPGANMHSLGTPIVISGIGAKLTVNLTEYPSALATLTVNADGAPVASAPIRVTLLPSFDNSTPVASLANALGNSTVLYTNSVGSASAYLPVGNYSTYASTYIGSTLETALGTIRIASPGARVTAAALELAPANWLTGTISNNTAGAGASSVVFAYDAQGNVAAVATDGSFSLALPSGTYSLLTLQASSSSTAPLDAALQTVAVNGPTSVAVVPVTALRTTFTVSATLQRGVLYPASNANVMIRIGSSGGPSIPMLTGSSGTVSYVVPAALPDNETYCLSASAVGYSPTSECIAPGSLPSVSRLPISFAPVTLTLPISGTTSSSLTTIYLNGTSATAGTYMVQGYTSASLTITPGTYSIQAYAPNEPNVTRYSSAPSRSFSVALGLSQVTKAVSLVRERNTTGSLRLPIGMPSSAVTMRLTGSTGFNLTVSGAAYTSGFYAPVGSYSAYFFGAYAGLNYTNLTVITVPAAGSIPTPLRLSMVGVTVSGSLIAMTHVPIVANTTVTFTAAGGAVAVTRTTYGSYSIVLAASTTYSISARTVGTVDGPNGSYAVNYATATGADACTVGKTGATCNVTMVGTTQLVWFNGTVGAPGLASPTLFLEGPYPSYTLSTISVTNGRFSVQILPGAYVVYANATGAAELTGVIVLAHSGPFALTLSPSYQDEITPMPPGGIVNGSVALVTVRSADGVTFEFPNVVVGSTLSLWLPTGGYTVGARTTGYPYAVLSNATASQSVAIVSGNVATRLSLAWVLVPSVVGAAVGPTSVDLPPNGGPVDFSVGLTNTGNVPVNISLSISPAYWNMTTTLTNVTLSPGAIISGSVRVIVPAGTSVVHPPLYLTAVTANGRVIGDVADLPTINIAPRYAMVLEGNDTSPSVGPHQVEIHFFVDNTGNVAIGLRLSVIDAPQLASIGWASNILQGPTVVTTYTVSPGTTEPFTLNLTSGVIAVPPTTAEVAVTILNESLNSQQTLTFSVPSTSVTVNPHTVVTGPGTGTAPVVYAEWLLIVLALVPTLIAGAIMVVWRWNRTRRWRRW